MPKTAKNNDKHENRQIERPKTPEIFKISKIQKIQIVCIPES